MALLAGSPAFGAGVIADYPGTTTPITTDQRGLPLDSPDPDIGAFQTQGSPLLAPSFSVSDQSITYGAPSVTVSGTLADGSLAPVGQTVSVTLDGVEQSATIGTGGAFSTTFATTGLTVADSPYTITYAYAYTSGAPFASASATSTLTVAPTLITLTVDSLGDAGVGSGDSGDLRYCIDQANADDQSNTIVFDPTVFGTPQTITLSGGPLELEDTGGTQTITGPAAGVTISGGGSSRVFQVDGGVTASISGLTISGGFARTEWRGLANYGTATLTGCPGQPRRRRRIQSLWGQPDPDRLHVSGNTGGGLGNEGTTLTDCTVSGNVFATIGSDNRRQRRRCGQYRHGHLTDCTVSGNTTVGNGGGVNNYGTATLTGCTISGNYGYDCGGVFNSGAAELTISDTIVAGNTNSFGASDIEGGGYISGSYNLIGTGGSGGLVNGVDGNIVGVANPLPGPAGQLRRADPDHRPARRQPRHRRGRDRRLPRHHHPDHHRSARPSARLSQSRHRRFPDPGGPTHRADLLGNQRPEHHLRHPQRDHLRNAGRRLAGPGGRDRRRDLGRCRAVGHHRLRRWLLHHLRHHRPHRGRFALYDRLRVYH